MGPYEKPLTPDEILRNLDEIKRRRDNKLKWDLVQECGLSPAAEIDSVSNAEREILAITISEKGVTTKMFLIDGKINLSATEQWSLSDDENAVQFTVEQIHKNHIDAAVSLFGLSD